MLKDIHQKTVETLSTLYEPNEANELSEWLIEHFYQKKRYQYDDLIAEVPEFSAALSRLLNAEPIQYVLNESFFYGFKFFVDQSVLIPRPETELLVEWVIKDQLNEKSTILDIGTGSGCIAISIKKKLAHSHLIGIDVSSMALDVAQKNALNLLAPVDFIHKDILKTIEWDHIRPNIIVSNPPYVKQSEAKDMQLNVLGFEPHLALFVEDADPLCFYKAIVTFAMNHLIRPGFVYFEINQSLALDMKIMLESAGFSRIVTRKDQYGNDRMMKAFLD